MINLKILINVNFNNLVFYSLVKIQYYLTKNHIKSRIFQQTKLKNLSKWCANCAILRRSRKWSHPNFFLVLKSESSDLAGYEFIRQLLPCVFAQNEWKEEDDLILAKNKHVSKNIFNE